jgi:hypothetical protein
LAIASDLDRFSSTFLNLPDLAKLFCSTLKKQRTDSEQLKTNSEEIINAVKNRPENKPGVIFQGFGKQRNPVRAGF